MRASLRAAALVAVCVAAGCKGDGFKLQDTMDSLIGDIEGLFGSSSAPAKYLGQIRDVHERKSWAFLPDAEEPLEKTRNAVRALATCDYASWAEASLVVEILSSMADEHPSSLVRAEALDTLTHIAPWTIKAVVPVDHPTSSADMIDGIKVLKDALGKDDLDPEFTAKVAGAVSALASFPFDKVEVPPPGSNDRGVLTRAYGTQLRTARGALRSINGRVLEGFLGNATVHESLDRAYVSLSASVIRLTLLKSALSDPADTTRVTALRDVGLVVPDGGGPVLTDVLLHDGFAGARREAAKSLAKYPRPVAVPPLIDVLAYELVEVRNAAGRSLETISGQTFGDDRAAWVKWWQTAGSKATPPEPGN
jgi:hypothetical protein